VYFAELKLQNMFLSLSCQLNKCTILQSAQPPCSQASLCFAEDSRLIFIILLVGLRYLDLISG